MSFNLEINQESVGISDRDIYIGFRMPSVYISSENTNIKEIIMIALHMRHFISLNNHISIKIILKYEDISIKIYNIM